MIARTNERAFEFSCSTRLCAPARFDLERARV